MDRYGLIGYPLTHSFSKKYFSEKLWREKIDAVYENYELPSIEDVKEVLQIPGLKGLNVTIPYKEKIIPYLDELDSMAEKIGAVNTIVIAKDKTKGYNTDHLGFTRSRQSLLQAHHQKALILGTGGSSAAVAYGLEELGITYRFVSRYSRSGMLYYEQVDKQVLDEYTILINTTPLGMYPDISAAPEIPYQFLSHRHLLFDLIYNPEQTLFLKKGLEQGATVKNGLEMLQIQAEEAWNIWTRR